MKNHISKLILLLLAVAISAALLVAAQGPATVPVVDTAALQREILALRQQNAQLLKRAMQCEYKDIDAEEKNLTGKLAALDAQAKNEADKKEAEKKTADKKEVPKKP